VLGRDLDLAGRDPEERLAVDHEAGHRADATRRSAVRILGDMKAVWHGRVTETVAKVSDQAPMAAVCCNACRTCVQTNLVAAALALAIAAGGAVGRVGRRLVGAR
jgi:hypothetical protein